MEFLYTMQIISLTVAAIATTITLGLMYGGRKK